MGTEQKTTYLSSSPDYGHISREVKVLLLAFTIPLLCEVKNELKQQRISKGTRILAKTKQCNPWTKTHTTKNKKNIKMFCFTFFSFHSFFFVDKTENWDILNFLSIYIRFFYITSYIAFVKKYFCIVFSCLLWFP